MSKTEFITDSLGRQLEIKPMGIADQFDLLEAAQNQAEYKRWFGLASLVFCCVSVDGVPLPTPCRPADFKKNSTILKDEGINAIAKHFMDQKTTEGEIKAQIEDVKKLTEDPAFRKFVVLVKAGVPYEYAISFSGVDCIHP